MLSTTKRDVVLNASHDWDLSSGTFKYTSGVDGVAQAIEFAVRMHRGEYFMNLARGIPYFEREGVSASEAILGQRGATDRAIEEYTKVILAVEGVASIVSITATLVNRVLNVAWTVTVKFDDIATTTVSGSTLIQR